MWMPFTLFLKKSKDLLKSFVWVVLVCGILLVFFSVELLVFLILYSFIFYSLFLILIMIALFVQPWLQTRREESYFVPLYNYSNATLWVSSLIWFVEYLLFITFDKLQLTEELSIFCNLWADFISTLSFTCCEQ